MPEVTANLSSPMISITKACRLGGSNFDLSTSSTGNRTVSSIFTGLKSYQTKTRLIYFHLGILNIH